MIKLTKLAQIIESDLNNAITGNREFKIYADVGDFKKSYKAYNSNEITRYINGILEAMAPSILPIRNLQAMTQTYRVSFVLDMAVLNKDENGNYIEVEQVRSVLEQYVAAKNGTSFTTSDDNGESFEFTADFGGVITGTASQLSPLGQVLPIYLDVSFTIVENGVNTNTVEFYLNGENLFFESYSVTRVRTCETNMVANEKSTKTLAQANGLSVTFKKPLLQSKMSLELEDDLYNGGMNKAYCFQRVRGDKKRNYIVIIGNNVESGALAQNIGQTIDLVEGKQNELEYGDEWTIEQVSGASAEITLDKASTYVVFWGDGASEEISVSEKATHTYATDGSHTIRYIKF